MKKTLLLFLLLFSGRLMLNAQCTASYTYLADPADNGNVYFHDTSSATLFPVISWNFGDGTTGWGTNPQHTYTTSGVYYACLTFQDSLSGCTTTYCDSIHVINSHLYCDALFYVASYDSLGYTSIADNSSGYMLSYAWDFGDGTTSTTAGNQYHTYTASGIYTVCLTVTTGGATCSSSMCDTFTLSSCHADYTYAFDAFGNGCTFTSSVTGSPDTYFWNFGDGGTSTLANPYHVFATNGSFYVTLQVTSTTDTTCSDSRSEYISATGICNASFYIVQDSSDLYNYFVYNYYYGNPMASYLWDFGDGTTSTTQYPTHTYADTLTYYMCLTVSDPTGCSDTYCDTINAGRSSGNLTMTVVPTPPPVTTGITAHTEVSTATLENFPNPFNGTTTINYSLVKDANVDIYVVDLLGNTVTTLEKGRKQSGSYTTAWNASGAAPGMYLLRMKTDNSMITKKMILTK